MKVKKDMREENKLSRLRTPYRHLLSQREKKEHSFHQTFANAKRSRPRRTEQMNSSLMQVSQVSLIELFALK